MATETPYQKFLRERPQNDLTKNFIFHAIVALGATIDGMEQGTYPKDPVVYEHLRTIAGAYTAHVMSGNVLGHNGSTHLGQQVIGKIKTEARASTFNGIGPD